jgi:hypothetical protein
MSFVKGAVGDAGKTHYGYMMSLRGCRSVWASSRWRRVRHKQAESVVLPTPVSVPVKVTPCAF